MTRVANLVSMSIWTPEEIARIQARFTGSAEPDGPRKRKRDRILAAAIELLVERGYRRTNMEDVARRAGVAKGTVYLYFPNKGTVLLTALAAEEERAFARILPLFEASVDPRDRLRDLIRLSLIVSQEMPLFSRLLNGDHEILYALDEMEQQAPDMLRESVDIGMRMMGALLNDVAPGRYTPEETEEHTRVLTGLFFFSGLLSSDQVRSGLSLERFADVLSRMLVDGIAPPTPAAPAPKARRSRRKR